MSEEKGMTLDRKCYRVNLSDRGRKRLDGVEFVGFDHESSGRLHVRAHNVVFEQGGAVSFWSLPVTSLDPITRGFRVDTRLVASFAAGCWETVEQLVDEPASPAAAEGGA